MYPSSVAITPEATARPERTCGPCPKKLPERGFSCPSVNSGTLSSFRAVTIFTTAGETFLTADAKLSKFSFKVPSWNFNCPVNHLAELPGLGCEVSFGAQDKSRHQHQDAHAWNRLRPMDTADHSFSLY